MAKFYVNAGELITGIIIEDVAKVPDNTGHYTETWTNIFGANAVTRCKWINAHGIEAVTDKQLGLGETATLQLRYSAKITPTCRVRKTADKVAEWWEVVSTDNINERGVWLEIKVKRKVAAK
jgi:head-tail adaptor